MTAQRLDAMLRAWSWTEGANALDVSTDYDAGTIAGRLSPSSFRRPHPLVGRATLTPETVVETAAMGLPVILGPKPDREIVRLYREALHQAGHDDETVAECKDWLGFVSMVSLAPTEREAERRLDRFVEGGGSAPIVSSAEEGSAAWVAEWKSRQLEKRNWSRPVTPQMLVEQLLSARELGVNHVRVAVADLPDEPEQNMETFRLFLEEVLPRLGPEPLRDPARTVLDPAPPAAATPSAGPSRP